MEISFETFRAIDKLIENNMFQSVQQLLIGYENHPQFNKLVFETISKGKLVWSIASAYKMKTVEQVDEAAHLVNYLDNEVRTRDIEKYSSDTWWQIMAHGALARRYCQFSMPQKAKAQHEISLSLARTYLKNRSRAIVWVVSGIRDDNCLAEPGLALLGEAVKYAEQIEDPALRSSELKSLASIRYPGFKYQGPVN